jgi:hypothetical protein
MPASSLKNQLASRAPAGLLPNRRADLVFLLSTIFSDLA